MFRRSNWPTLSFTIYFTVDHVRIIITNISQWLVTSIKIEIQQCIKLKIDRAVFFLTSGVFLLRDASNDSVCGPREFHPEMSLEQSMVNKLKMLSVVCFYKQKHSTNLECTPN